MSVSLNMAKDETMGQANHGIDEIVCSMAREEVRMLVFLDGNQSELINFADWLDVVAWM